jgi:uncharacterized membrane protein
MDNSIWTKLHGGSTHFPIALAMAATLFDLASVVAPDNPQKTRRLAFRVAGFYTLILGALGSYAAVASGLVMSRGQIWGRGDLARHHLFVWPSFALLIGLAAWRLTLTNHSSQGVSRLYLVVSVVVCGLISAAGYYGGELLIHG